MDMNYKYGPVDWRVSSVSTGFSHAQIMQTSPSVLCKQIMQTNPINLMFSCQPKMKQDHVVGDTKIQHVHRLMRIIPLYPHQNVIQYYIQYTLW
jgi:hypothetical protein